MGSSGTGGKTGPSESNRPALTDAQSQIILDTIREVVFRVDDQGRWLFLNQAWEKLTEHAVADCLGKPASDFVHPDDVAVFKSLLRGLRRSPTGQVSSQIRCLQASGGFRYVDVCCLRAEWEPGVFEAYGTIADVTHQLQVEQTLKGQRTLLRNVIDSDPNFVYVRNRQGVFVLANRAIAEYYGTIPSGLVGKSDADFNRNQEEVEQFREMDRQLLDSGLDEMTYEVKLKGPTGPRWFHTVKRPIISPKTGERQVLGISCDMTETVLNQRELVAAREAALEASRMKSEFLANMSHEIRTPMNGVIGMSDLLIDSELAPEHREMVRTIRESAESLLTILNDILDFSKIEAGKMSMESLPVDLADLLERVSVSFAQRADAKGLAFEIDIDWRHPWTYATDPVRLRQVLTNLISNAVKFTEEGEVRVILEIGPNGLPTIQVQDTGIGIPKDRLSTVFGPFTQADGSVTRKYGGTGLGLAIAKHLMSLLGGSISVDSEPNRGSRFTLELDIPSLTCSFSDERRLFGRKIAIITDDPHVAIAGRGALLSLGAAVAPAEGDPEAILFDARQGAPLPFGRIIALLPLGTPIPDGAAAAIYEPLTRRALIDAVMRAVGGRPALQPMVANALRRGRALLVEDNAVNRQVAVRQLEKEGLTVELASTGVEAIRCTARYDYDLVIMDVQMPEMDGLEATRRIRLRDDAVGRHVPIVAMTAHAMKGDRERCLEAGMDDYMCKPLRREELKEKVAVWVDASEVPGICDLDEAYVLTTFGEDRDFLAEVLLTYVNSTDQLLLELREALEVGDQSRARSLAHTLKGSSRSIGANTFADQCEVLERAGSADEIAAAGQRLIRETPRVLAGCRTRARRLRTPQHA